MPHDVTMPQLGMAQDAGKIVSWLKAPGDPVSKGDALFEVETDKAVMEVESPAAGYLTGVAYGEGEDVPVGKVIARISDSAEEAEGLCIPALRIPAPVLSRAPKGDATARGAFPINPNAPSLRHGAKCRYLAALRFSVTCLKAPGRAGRVTVAPEDSFFFEVEARQVNATEWRSRPAPA